MSTPRVSSRSTTVIDSATGLGLEVPDSMLRPEAPAKPFAVHFAKPVFVFFPDKPSRPESITRFRSDDERMKDSAWEVTSVGIIINGTTIPFGNIVCFGEGL